MKGNTS
jgi:hypothetical protein